MWLYVRFPLLLLDRALGAQLVVREPQALLEQRRITEANRCAQAAGVRPGQSLSTARTLCPELQCRTPCPQRMQQQLEQLALWAYRFTPEVSLVQPSGLLMNVTASLKLFRGFTPLFQRFRWGFRKRRIPAVYGLGHSPLAAELISHTTLDILSLLDEQGQLNQDAVIQALNKLPVHYLPCPEKSRTQLQTMGLDTVGDVAALPRAALSRRFGHTFSSLLDRLYGDEADLRSHFQPPDHFYGERQFNGSLTRVEELRFPIAALLGELEHFLQLKQWVNRHLDWHFHYCDGESEQLCMAVSHQHVERRRMLRLVMLKLERFRLQGPVDSLTLICKHFESVAQRNTELFQHSSVFDHQRHERYLAVLDKLEARLGRKRLWQARPCHEHLPEYATQHFHPLAARTPPAPQGSSALRPLWLASPPQALAEDRGTLRWQGENLQLLQGPERLDNQWWQQRQVRDYYIARTDSGVVCWLYRDCLQQCWFLHGLFG